jgi:hypothetical protein
MPETESGTGNVSSTTDDPNRRDPDPGGSTGLGAGDDDEEDEGGGIAGGAGSDVSPSDTTEEDTTTTEEDTTDDDSNEGETPDDTVTTDPRDLNQDGVVTPREVFEYEGHEEYQTHEFTPNEEIFAAEDEKERIARLDPNHPDHGIPTGGYINSHGQLVGDHGLNSERAAAETRRLQEAGHDVVVIPDPNALPIGSGSENVHPKIPTDLPLDIQYNFQTAVRALDLSVTDVDPNRLSELQSNFYDAQSSLIQFLRTKTDNAIEIQNIINQLRTISVSQPGTTRYGSQVIAIGGDLNKLATREEIEDLRISLNIHDETLSDGNVFDTQATLDKLREGSDNPVVNALREGVTDQELRDQNISRSVIQQAKAIIVLDPFVVDGKLDLKAALEGGVPIGLLTWIGYDRDELIAYKEAISNQTTTVETSTDDTQWVVTNTGRITYEEYLNSVQRVRDTEAVDSNGNINLVTAIRGGVDTQTLLNLNVKASDIYDAKRYIEVQDIRDRYQDIVGDSKPLEYMAQGGKASDLLLAGLIKPEIASTLNVIADEGVLNSDGTIDLERLVEIPEYWEHADNLGISNEDVALAIDIKNLKSLYEYQDQDGIDLKQAILDGRSFQELKGLKLDPEYLTALEKTQKYWDTQGNIDYNSASVDDSITNSDWEALGIDISSVREINTSNARLENALERAAENIQDPNVTDLLDYGVTEEDLLTLGNTESDVSTIVHQKQILDRMVRTEDGRYDLIASLDSLDSVELLEAGFDQNDVLEAVRTKETIDRYTSSNGFELSQAIQDGVSKEELNKLGFTDEDIIASMPEDLSNKLMDVGISLIPIVGTTRYAIDVSEGGFSRAELAWLSASALADVLFVVPIAGAAARTSISGARIIAPLGPRARAAIAARNAGVLTSNVVRGVFQAPIITSRIVATSPKNLLRLTVKTSEAVTSKGPLTVPIVSGKVIAHVVEKSPAAADQVARIVGNTVTATTITLPKIVVRDGSKVAFNLAKGTIATPIKIGEGIARTVEFIPTAVDDIARVTGKVVTRSSDVAVELLNTGIKITTSKGPLSVPIYSGQGIAKTVEFLPGSLDFIMSQGSRAFGVIKTPGSKLVRAADGTVKQAFEVRLVDLASGYVKDLWFPVRHPYRTVHELFNLATGRTAISNTDIIKYSSRSLGSTPDDFGPLLDPGDTPRFPEGPRPDEPYSWTLNPRGNRPPETPDELLGWSSSRSSRNVTITEPAVEPIPDLPEVEPVVPLPETPVRTFPDTEPYILPFVPTPDSPEPVEPQPTPEVQPETPETEPVPTPQEPFEPEIPPIEVPDLDPIIITPDIDPDETTNPETPFTVPEPPEVDPLEIREPLPTEVPEVDPTTITVPGIEFPDIDPYTLPDEVEITEPERTVILEPTPYPDSPGLIQFPEPAITPSGEPGEFPNPLIDPLPDFDDSGITDPDTGGTPGTRPYTDPLTDPAIDPNIDPSVDPNIVTEPYTEPFTDPLDETITLPEPDTPGQPEVGVPTKTPPRRPTRITIPIPDSPDDKKKKKYPRGKKMRSVAWRQGTIWVTVRPPYDEQSIQHSRARPTDALIVGNARDAFNTLEYWGVLIPAETYDEWATWMSPNTISEVRI